jgi:hypothetical protein
VEKLQYLPQVMVAVEVTVMEEEVVVVQLLL